MSEYGSGISATQAFLYDRERIQHALKGQIFVGEDENKFIYSECSKKEADEYILSAFDNAAFLCTQSYANAKAFEEFIAEKVGAETYAEYIKEFIRSGGFMKYQGDIYCPEDEEPEADE